MRFLTGWLLILITFSATSLATAADTVTLHLRNGDRLTGTVLSEDATHLKLSTPWQQEIRIPLAEIEKREKIAPKPTAQAAEAKPAPPPPAPAPPAEPPPPPKPPKHWFFDIQAGVDLARSQADRELYTGRIKVNYANPATKFRNEFDYKAAYGTTDGRLSANRMDGAIKTDVDIGRRLFVYNLGVAGYDEIRRTDFQYEVGPGVGYHLITKSNFVMNTEFGGSYQEQFYSDSTKRQDFRLRLAEDFTWRVNKRLMLEEKFEFMPRAQEPSNYRMRFETTMRLFLIDNLSLNFTVLDLYDTDPAPGVSNNDLQIRSSIGIKF
ncbi:MAG: DUF481 domain-containing protein [Verrucomicrobiota bacterium]